MRPFLRPALGLLAIFVVLTGFVFPFAIWCIGQTLFPSQAGGSLVRDSGGRVVGSGLIGQDFTDPRYFQPRPSACGYDAANSGGTNLGPTSPKLAESMRRLASAYRLSNGLSPNAQVPVDAVTNSASGLDPDISVANAEIQVGRVAKARGLSKDTVEALVREHTERRLFGLYGERRVNVLLLNLALDRL